MVRDWDNHIQASRPHHQCHRPVRHLRRPVPRADPEGVCPRRNRSERCGGIAKAIVVDAARLWRVWLVRCDVHIYAIGHRARINISTYCGDRADAVETAIVCFRSTSTVKKLSHRDDLPNFGRPTGNRLRDRVVRETGTRTTRTRDKQDCQRPVHYSASANDKSRVNCAIVHRPAITGARGWNRLYPPTLVAVPEL